MASVKVFSLASALVVASVLPVQLIAQPAFPGPYGAPGMAPGTAAPGMAPGMGPGMGMPPVDRETLERYDFFAPYGPSPTDIRRFYRDLRFGRIGPGSDWEGPLGPSPTDLRREQRRQEAQQFRQGRMPY